MISIALNDAVRKGQTAQFARRLTPSMGKWSAPAANEVAP
jgi:hypothetical protein